MSLIAAGAGMLVSWFTGKLGKALVGSAVDGVVGAVKQYIGKEITKEELETRLQETLAQSAATVEIAHADAVAKTYASFTSTWKDVPIAVKVWAVVTLSMLFVILWHAFAIPLLVWQFGGSFPSSGNLADYAYGILVLCIGGGAYALKGGDWLDRVKGAMKR